MVLGINSVKENISRRDERAAAKLIGLIKNNHAEAIKQNVMRRISFEGLRDGEPSQIEKERNWPLCSGR